MHSSSHSRSRRQHDNNGNDEETSLPPVSRGEDTAYSRPHYSHHSESYRTSSSSSRNPSYDMGGGNSSRNRSGDDWRTRGSSSHDRYNYSSSSEYHRRSSRDEHDIRDTEGWTGRNDSRYSSRRWGGSRYDHDYSTSTYPDPSQPWAGSATYEDRSNRDQWTLDKKRSKDERGRGRAVDERSSDKETSGWQKDDRRDDGTQNWQRDSGWGSRRQSNRENDARLPDDSQREETHNAGGRSWEPSSMWATSDHGKQGQKNLQNRSQRSNKSVKNGKKNARPNKQKRDWRADDGTLNNWPKRDAHESSKSKPVPSSSRKNRIRSSSPRRSRSPAESYYSRRSSRGRSRSRSASPKRRRRDSSPPRARSRTPSDWDGGGYTPTRSGTPPSPRFGARRARKRSLSFGTASITSKTRGISRSRSRSRTRSLSHSPEGRPKTLHRLPPTTTIKDIPLAKGNGSRKLGMLPPKDNTHRNGKSNGKNRRNAPVVHTETQTTLTHPSSTVTAPSTKHKTHDSPREISVSLSNPEIHSQSTSKETRIGIKSAGFKPIGQTSSAVKRFFPGDDDDDSDAVPSGLLEASDTQSFLAPVVPRDLEPSSGTSERRKKDMPRNRHESSDRPDHHPSAHPSPHQNVSTISSVHEDFGVSHENHNDDHGNAIATPRIHEQDQEVRHIASPSSDSRGELYEIVSQVGEGTFGKVYKARNIITRHHVALKRIRMEAERDGFPVTAMREIKLLQSLRHENVVQLYEMMVSNGSVYMVFEYMDHDLTGVLSQTQFSFTDAHLKSLCHQMLAGLGYLHHKGVIHRDIKGSNILINNRGELKLADFGLARFYQKRRRSDYTNRVITLWYRPPELLFGATVYGPEVDMWSAGCIMLELFTKKPIFQGNDEIHQLEVIYKIFGTPTVERWSGVMNLPWYELIKPRELIPNRFRELFHKWLSPAGLDLAEKLLSYNPEERFTAAQAMEAPYFLQEDPPAALPVGLSTLEGEWHELETKRERAKKRRKTESTIP